MNTEINKKINFIGGPYPWREHLKPNTDLQKDFALINGLIDRYPFFAEAGNIVMLDEQHPFIIAGLRFDARKKKEYFLVASNLDTFRAHRLKIAAKKNLGNCPVEECLREWELCLGPKERTPARTTAQWDFDYSGESAQAPIIASVAPHGRPSTSPASTKTQE